MLKKKIIRLEKTFMVILVVIGIVFSCCVEEEKEKSPPAIIYPTVISTSPAKYASDVSPTPIIRIVFSKPMYESETAYKAISFAPSIPIEDLKSCWMDNKTLEISNLVFEYGKKYTLKLNPELGELKDIEGNYLKQYSWSFTITSVPIIDMVDAIDQNLVEASVIGWKSNLVILELRRLIEYEIEIKIPRGLILHSLDNSKSNMAMEDVYGVISSITPGYLITINYYVTSKIILDKDEKKYLIGAYSVEFNKPTPGYKKEFSIGKVNSDIQKILETEDLLDIRDKSTDAVQTAIWCFTDNMSKKELLEKREIRNKEILDAKTILELAGIETSSKKLFSEEIVILSAKIKEKLEDEGLVIYVNEMRESDKINWTKAEEGCRWVIIDIIIKNKMDETLKVNPYRICLRDGNNRIHVYTHSYRTKDLDFGFKEWNIPPKTMYRGELAFEVPNEVTSLIASYNDSISYGEIELIQSSSPESMPVSDLTPTYKIGEKATDENVVITVNSKRETDTIGDSQVKENWSFLILDITIENISDRSLTYSYIRFYIQDENGHLFEYHYTTSRLDNPFEHGSLQFGEKHQGEIVFKIPKLSKLTLWYSPYSGPPVCIGLWE
jgi:hypothetical protein